MEKRVLLHAAAPNATQKNEEVLEWYENGGVRGFSLCFILFLINLGRFSLGDTASVRGIYGRRGKCVGWGYMM